MIINSYMVLQQVLEEYMYYDILSSALLLPTCKRNYATMFLDHLRIVLEEYLIIVY